MLDSSPILASATEGAIPVHPLFEAELEAFLAGRRPSARVLAAQAQFKAKAGQVLVLPAPGGQVERVLMGLGTRAAVDPGLFRTLAGKLPAGDYRLARLPRGLDAQEATLAFALGLYRFDRYRKRSGEAGPRLVAPKGVDLVFDPVGGETTLASLRVIGWGDRLMIVGFASGTIPQIPANILLVKTLAVMGFNYGYYVGWSPHDARFEEAERTFALAERIRGWCEQDLCRPHVDRTFALPDAAQAMRALLERSVTGRVAIVMD